MTDNDTPLYSCEDLPIRQINMNKPPNERWLPLIKEYKEPIRECYRILDDRVRQMIGKFPRWSLNMTIKMIVKMYGKHKHYNEELLSIAQELELPVEKVILAQYGYEFFTACTSVIVSDDENQSPIHLRTMDWDDNTLRPLTIRLDVIEDDKLVASATTWAGFIGFMTIVKPNVCSISVNYRRNDSKLWYYPANLLYILSGRLTVSYLIREAVLGNIGDNYRDIATYLKKTPLIAPCYITMTGVNFDSGMVLVRDRNDCLTHNISLTNSDDYYYGYLVQTNNDPGDFRESRNDKYSIERRSIFTNVIFDQLRDIQKDAVEGYNGRDYIDYEGCRDAFLTEPILKCNVVYFSIMSPGGFRLITDTKNHIYNRSQQIYPSNKLPILAKGPLKRFWNQYPVPTPPLFGHIKKKLDDDDMSDTL
jgi:hypothetical protein